MRGEQLQGKERQQWQDEPAHKPKRGQPFDDRKVIHGGRFERGEVVGIDADPMQAERHVASILDLQEHGLNASPGQRYSKHLITFGGIQHRHGHSGGGDFLRLASRQERSHQRLRSIRRREQTPQQGLSVRHQVFRSVGVAGRAVFNCVNRREIASQNQPAAQAKLRSSNVQPALARVDVAHFVTRNGKRPRIEV